MRALNYLEAIQSNCYVNITSNCQGSRFAEANSSLGGKQYRIPNEI